MRSWRNTVLQWNDRNDERRQQVELLFSLLIFVGPIDTQRLHSHSTKACVWSVVRACECISNWWRLLLMRTIYVLVTKSRVMRYSVCYLSALSSGAKPYAWIRDSCGQWDASWVLRRQWALIQHENDGDDNQIYIVCICEREQRLIDVRAHSAMCDTLPNGWDGALAFAMSVERHMNDSWLEYN